MYYYPARKKNIREDQRFSPECSGRCYRAILLIVGIGMLFLLLVGLVLLMRNSGSPNDRPGIGGTASSPIVSSVPPSSSTPPETSVPSTSSGSVDSADRYTREELEAMDTSYNEDGFGAGLGKNHARPSTPVAQQKKYSQYDAYFIGEDTKTVYLTFDCGYEHYATDANGQKYPVTGKILDILKEKNVKGVFFITMSYAKRNPKLVQRMIDEGHTVGNHSTNHPIMPSLSIDKMEYEVMSLHEYVLEHFDYKMFLFRPPTGAYSVQSLAVLQNLGYKTVLWSFQHFDYDPENQPSETTAYNTITNHTHNGAIYLLHAVSEANAAALDDVIDYLNTEGYAINLLS